MTEQDVKRTIEAENNHMEYLYDETLKKCFNGKIPEKCTLSDWFRFNEMWNKSGAYDDSCIIQKHLRDAGYDVKMSMTDKYKLSYHGVMV